MNTKTDREFEKDKEQPRAHSSLARIAAIPACVIFVFGSLMTFPAGLPWMMLVWLLVACGFNRRYQSPVWPLVILTMVVVIKNPEWSAALFTFLAACGLATWVYWSRGKLTVKTWWPLWTLTVVWLGFLVDFVFASHQSGGRGVDRQLVVCLGDSLTDYGYPQELEKLIVQPVADFGFDGITSQDGVNKLDEIIALQPRVLVLELGGHDYNRGFSRVEAQENLTKIIEACHDNEIEVVVVEIPRGFIRDPWRGLERELARQYDLNLVSDTVVRRFILFSPLIPPGMWLSEDQHLSNDGLHPNKIGNKAFAEAVANGLAPFAQRRK